MLRSERMARNLLLIGVVADDSGRLLSLTVFLPLGYLDRFAIRLSRGDTRMDFSNDR